MEELNKLVSIVPIRPGNDIKSCVTDKNIDSGINQKVYEDYEKVFILFQAYLMHIEFDNSSLISDTIYIVQNSMRILRCVLEICLKKNIASVVDLLLTWSKLLENKMLPEDHVLFQFCFENSSGNFSAMKSRKEYKEGFLSQDLVFRVQDKELNLSTLREMSSAEISSAIGLNKRGEIIKQYCNYIPLIECQWDMKPIAQTIIKMTININCSFKYTPRWHKRTEILWVIVDDEIEILHSEQIAFSIKNLQEKTQVSSTFFVPYRGQDSNSQYRLKIASDRWLGSEFIEIIDMNKIIVHQDDMEYTKLLDLQPLPTSALNNVIYEKLYKFQFFNPVQTQAFHALYHTDNNVLIGAPTGSGKTNMAEFAILRLFNVHPNKKVIYIAPLKVI